jgi:arylsulfatase A-like enzyme
MIEHDMHVGQLLDLLDELGIADKTIVQYSTDNGPHYNTWPDARFVQSGKSPEADRSQPGRPVKQCSQLAPPN